MKKLIIAEKPELARAIAAIIPGNRKDGRNNIMIGNYIITWAVGHILRHKKPEEIDEKYRKWNIEDLPIFFRKWPKVPIKGKEEILKNIKLLLEETEEVIHAGDPDDEGQYLIDEILEYCNYKGTVKRLLINNNSMEAVKKSFEKIEHNHKYVNLGKAAEARAISDMIVGFNLSRFFTLYNNAREALTIGRVQTPTLALVVNRDYEIKNHIKEKYYELYFNMEIKNSIVRMKYIVPKNFEEKIIKDRSKIESIINKLNNEEGIFTVRRKEGYISAPLPFNLAKLQTEASSKFGYSAQKTQDITQILRDKHSAITYNRSDCEYLSDEHFNEAPDLIPVIIKKLGLSELKINIVKENKPRCFNNNITDSSAHHGIIPTLSGDISKFSIEEKNIYELIAKRYLIQFMDDEKIEKTEAILTVSNEIFRTSSIKVLEKGYKNFYIEDNGDNSEKSKDSYSESLQNIPNGEYRIILKNKNLEIEEKETKAKKPYTESALISDMTSISKYVKNEKIRLILKEKDKEKKGENGSIGTPATRASIIEGLFKRKYLERKGKTITSTELAREYLSTLPENLKSADMTALWWSMQEEIKEGKSEKEKLTDFVLHQTIKIMEEKYKKIENSEIIGKYEVLCKCPKCGIGNIIEGKKAFYCSEYKNACKFSIWKESKYFNQKLKISKASAKKLIKGDKVPLKLKSKEGKEYEAYFTMKINGDYVNLEKGDFVNRKKK